MGVFWYLLARETLKRRHWVPAACVGDCSCRQVCSVNAECPQVLKGSKNHSLHKSLYIDPTPCFLLPPAQVTFSCHWNNTEASPCLTHFL